MNYFTDETDKKLIIANTGEVKFGGCDAVLKSSPIGSCVVVVFFDESEKAGSMAHIMLPGEPHEKSIYPARYASHAISEAVKKMKTKKTGVPNLKAVVVGGGNVLKRPNETIGNENLNSVFKLLNERNIPVLAQSVGGTDRKSVRFDIETGTLYFSEGDSPEKILYEVGLVAVKK